MDLQLRLISWPLLVLGRRDSSPCCSGLWHSLVSEGQWGI